MFAKTGRRPFQGLLPMELNELESALTNNNQAFAQREGQCGARGSIGNQPQKKNSNVQMSQAHPDKY